MYKKSENFVQRSNNAVLELYRKRIENTHRESERDGGSAIEYPKPNQNTQIILWNSTTAFILCTGIDDDDDDGMEKEENQHQIGACTCKSL